MNRNTFNHPVRYRRLASAAAAPLAAVALAVAGPTLAQASGPAQSTNSVSVKVPTPPPPVPGGRHRDCWPHPPHGGSWGSGCAGSDGSWRSRH